MKLKHIVLFSALATAVASCNEEKFLDNKPQGTLNDAVLNSIAGVDLLINAAYAAQMGTEPQGNAAFHPTSNWSYGEVRSDNAYKGGGGAGDVWEIHAMETYTTDAFNGNLDVRWFQLYSSIQRCNTALQALSRVTDQQVPAKELRIAEMRALRAHFYFELSRLFNKIPWIDDTLEPSQYASVRNDELTRDQILEKIGAEFEAAAAVLPENSPADGLGRINKYMALAYAAKANLYRAYQQDASNQVSSINSTLMQKVVQLTRQVRSSGKYALLDDFQKLDLLQYENGPESVWAIQYSMNDGSGAAGRINWSNLLNAPQGPYSGDGFYHPSQNLMNAYKTDASGLPLLDGSFDASNFDVVTLNGDVATNSNHSSPVDPRLDFVIGRPNVRWKTYPNSSYKASWVRDRATYGYLSNKRFFVSPESSDMYKGWPWGASGLNWQIIRFAHILLWEAEAQIELGNLDEARQLINQIRDRAKNSAYVKAWTPAPGDATVYPNFGGYAANYVINPYPSAGWTQDYARRALRFETRLETAMEGERYFDLVRWGIAEPTMNRYFAVEKANRVYYNNSKFTRGKDEYYPIPQNQYKFSGNNYVQNPGYGAF